MPFLRLVAPDNVLPLGWEVMRHIGSANRPATAPPFVMDGAPVEGSALATRLRNLGYGPHPVTVSGVLVPHGMGGIENAYTPWSQSGEITLTISPQELGDLVYALCRQEIASFPKDETPGQLYVTSIEIGVAGEEPEEPETLYIDRMTGDFVSRDTWERSRRAIRAHAKRKGVRPRTGRYVRVKV